MEPRHASRIAIVGAGSVGAAIAHRCMIRRVGKTIALHDVDRAKVEAQALDLDHAVHCVATATVEGSDDVAVCAKADVIVITIGAKQKPGQSRSELAAANAAVLKSLVPQLVQVAQDAILLVVSNPVDVMTYVALKLSGLPARRMLGSGTVMDSSRFRFLIARRCRVALESVHAYIAAEQGEAKVPLWSSASIANVPLHQWAVAGHGKLTVRDRTEIFQNVKQSAQQIIAGKGAASYSIGVATSRIIEAVLNDESAILPVSALLSDYRGISDVCLSVPSIVNRGGVELALPVPLNEAEEAGLRNSVDGVRAAARSLGF